jgi:hypothetical protein
MWLPSSILSKAYRVFLYSDVQAEERKGKHLGEDALEYYSTTLLHTEMLN